MGNIWAKCKTRHAQLVKNRILSMILALSMCFGTMIPSTVAYAAPATGSDMVAENDVDQEEISDEEVSGEEASDEEEISDDEATSDEEVSDDEEASDDEASDDEESSDEEASDEETSDDEEAEDVSFTVQGDDIDITITGSTDSMDNVDDVVVRDITESWKDDYEEYLNSQGDKWVYTVLVVYDIMLLDKDHNEVEPSDEVQVSFAGDVIDGLASEDGTVEVYHNDEPDEEKVTSLAAMELSVDEDEVLTFMTDGFSPYALVLKEGSETQKELSFDDKTFFEMDKYLETTGELNGQNTYDIYLEQAFYDGTHNQINNYAPARTDFMLAIDQSASVSGYTEDYNNGIAKMIEMIAEVNKKREQTAREGGYDDIDPDYVNQSDANMVEAMKDHYMYVAGVVGYNNHLYYKHNAVGNPTLIRTDADVRAMQAKCYVKHDYPEYCAAGGNANTDQQDFTRTDLATEQLYTWAGQGSWNYKYQSADGTVNWNSLACVLITDGAPYGEAKTPTWPYPPDDYPGISISSYSTNRALQYANKLKTEYGSTNFAIYCPFKNENDPSVIKAFTTGRIDDLVIRPKTDILTLAFCSLWSSDHPKNGNFRTNGTSLTGEYVKTSGVGAAARNTFGKYISSTRQVSDLIEYVDKIVTRTDMEAWSLTNSRGYFGKETILQDEITDPFEVTSKSDILVYAVPRIPVNLDSNGRPTDMDPDTKEVSEFRWGEQFIEEDDETFSTEWVDITKEVNVTLNGNLVKVTGYDFEYNAVTDYDKDFARYEEDDSRSNGAIYKAGDYGYKVVVVIPIYTKFTFGGNTIKTNNEDVSGIIPSEPSIDNPNPPWEDNETLNPNGDEFIGMYPTPEVDLNVSYMITKDNAVIYAPQTQELHDLLTDEILNQIWYTDPGYSNMKSLRDAAKTELDLANEAYDAARDGEDPIALMEAEQAVMKASDAYYEAQKNLEDVTCYIPDGINNAFVDITYNFHDPDGELLGTMYVPHGKAYVVDDDGNPNIDWTLYTDGQVLNERGNPTIIKSGVYSISATVTPVDTDRSPDWHVHTEANDSSVAETYPYDSMDYSPTGSTAGGSQSAVTVEENPEAYLFTLEITAEDSRREPGQAIDFHEGPGQLRDMIERSTNKHITGFKWVCTDGVTESIPENEPGISKLMKVGSDTMLEIYVPDQAYTDGLVENVANTVTIRSGSDTFVPVNVLVTRTTGDLNKSVGTVEQVRQRSVVMSDSDNIYGGGVSSVRWSHDCGVLTKWDCNGDGYEFDQAQAYNDLEAEDHQGKVRFLMHVFENPEPDISKSTTTPVITVGTDIDWTVLVENTDPEKNKSMLPSEFSMIDVLPWTGDERVDPAYGVDRKDGSRFGGTLYYKKMVVDISDAAYGAQNMTVYYTTDTAVRTAEEGQLTGAKEGISWIQAETYEVSDTELGFTVPNDAVAVRLDTVLDWDESILVNLVANVLDKDDQNVGDYYHNAAWIAQNKGTIIESNVVATQVVKLYIAGTVWEDSDNNGLKMATEPTVPDVKITLYRKYEPMNPNRVVRTINGVQLVEAYDGDNNKFVPFITDNTGSYVFDNVQSGTYYVVADLIPDHYEMTDQRVGEGNSNNSRLDSEAEEEFIDSGEALEKTAWIKEIVIDTASADYQNFGLRPILGDIRVGKVVNEIYYPSAMTEEEREDYQINCTFILKSQADGKEYRRTVYLRENNIHLLHSRPQVWAEFNDLPVGTYELTELFDPNYHLDGVKYTKGTVSFDKASGATTVEITPSDRDVELWMENTARPDPPAGDENGVKNPITIKTPIKLEVVYSGADPISSKDAYSYTFVESDFDNSKTATDGSGRMGDIIVTYDDGSQIKLSDGTLKFEWLTFSPATLDSSMNSDTRRTTVTVYYAERGHQVRDSFNVRVDLKPYFKFTAKFHGNGSTFNTNEVTNQVTFVYNELLGYNEVTQGIYKDTNNNGLNVLDGFWQAGWNTQEDGQGFQYGDDKDALTPLQTIGQEKQLNSLDLYANWKTNVTFNANGGVLSNGQASTNVVFSKNQSIATSLTASRTGYCFVLWNTKPDGTGEEISEYNRNHNGCQGPVTFYAIYYQSDYYYTGTVQTFTAPVDGVYQFELWGSPGGAGAGNPYRSPGGFTRFYIHLDQNDLLYVFVGGAGNPSSGNITVGGWNGGGAVSTCLVGPHCGSGGGMTHVSYTNNLATTSWNPYGTIGVAGGGGGTSDGSSGAGVGGVGGGFAGGTGTGYNKNRVNYHIPYGATQTSGYRPGVGEPCANSAGGGGGWYGGYSTGQTRQTHGRNCRAGGGGGSGYICDAGKQTKFTYLNLCIPGNDTRVPAKPNALTSLGDHGYTRITLQERDK